MQALLFGVLNIYASNVLFYFVEFLIYNISLPHLYFEGVNTVFSLSPWMALSLLLSIQILAYCYKQFFKYPHLLYQT